ncbi:GNAT family N-acetyltransferase [Yimella lutea]|nr:GNAT family protein [Yimella lutea]
MLTDHMPLIETGSIRLRQFAPKDSPLVASVSDDPLIPLITTVPSNPEPAELEAYLARQHGRFSQGWGYSFAIADRDTDDAVGQLSLALRNLSFGRASVGYWIVPAQRRQGRARAALAAITDWALRFDQVHRLELYVEPWNEGSWRTAEACGYEREGLLRSWEWVGDQRRDMYLYSRIAG